MLTSQQTRRMKRKIVYAEAESDDSDIDKPSLGLPVGKRSKNRLRLKQD